MLNHTRLQSKKISKTEAVQSILDSPLEDGNIHIARAITSPGRRITRSASCGSKAGASGGSPERGTSPLRGGFSQQRRGDHRCHSLLPAGQKPEDRGSPVFRFGLYHEAPAEQIPDQEARQRLEAFIRAVGEVGSAFVYAQSVDRGRPRSDSARHFQICSPLGSPSQHPHFYRSGVNLLAAWAMAVGEWLQGCSLIVLAGFFDILDGAVARNCRQPVLLGLSWIRSWTGIPT